ncbi:MAG TPA: Flp family type IVb pilin [Devosiaceae bacterium]
MTDLGIHLRKFADDENGATAVEYGLITALISVAAIAAFVVLGGGLSNLFGMNAGSGGAGGAIQSAADTL